jgi:hypothetical protein
MWELSRKQDVTAQQSSRVTRKQTGVPWHSAVHDDVGCPLKKGVWPRILKVDEVKLVCHSYQVPGYELQRG